MILTICHQRTHSSIFDQRAAEEKLTRYRRLVAKMTCGANLDIKYELNTPLLKQSNIHTYNDEAVEVEVVRDRRQNVEEGKRLGSAFPGKVAVHCSGTVISPASDEPQLRF